MQEWGSDCLDDLGMHWMSMDMHWIEHGCDTGWGYWGCWYCNPILTASWSWFEDPSEDSWSRGSVSLLLDSPPIHPGSCAGLMASWGVHKGQGKVCWWWIVGWSYQVCVEWLLVALIVDTKFCSQIQVPSIQQALQRQTLFRLKLLVFTGLPT